MSGGASHLIEDAIQQNLFCQPEREGKEEGLSKVSDLSNERYGRGTIFHASEGTEKKWAMRREFKTASYTTRWEELKVVK